VLSVACIVASAGLASSAEVANAALVLPEAKIVRVVGSGPHGCADAHVRLGVSIKDLFATGKTSTQLVTRIYLDGKLYGPRHWNLRKGSRGRLLRYDLVLDTSAWKRGRHKLILGITDAGEGDFEMYVFATVFRCGQMVKRVSFVG